MNPDLLIEIPEGFDIRGLEAYCATEPPGVVGGVVVGREADAFDEWVAVRGGGIFGVSRIRMSAARLSLEDSATRDRFERWGRLRAFLHALPEHRVTFRGLRGAVAVFDLVSPEFAREACVRPASVPDLDAIDGSEAVLPDGSRLVDAQAFAAVVRHLTRGKSHLTRGKK